MARTTKATRQAQTARHEAIMAASADEGARFNKAIKAGAVVMLQTFSGAYRVEYVDRDFWYHTPEANGGFGQSWAGCNDGTWASLLRQAGISRNPLWAHLA